MNVKYQISFYQQIHIHSSFFVYAAVATKILERRRRKLWSCCTVIVCDRCCFIIVVVLKIHCVQQYSPKDNDGRTISALVAKTFGGNARKHFSHFCPCTNRNTRIGDGFCFAFKELDDDVDECSDDGGNGGDILLSLFLSSV